MMSYLPGGFLPTGHLPTGYFPGGEGGEPPEEQPFVYVVGARLPEQPAARALALNPRGERLP
jgi:hypothetical protein